MKYLTLFVSVYIVGLCSLMLAPKVAGQKPAKVDRPSAVTAGCGYWRSLVDRSMKKPSSTSSVNESDTETIMFGIKCLLTLQGNKNPARFSGVVRTDVSQTFDEATADVAALYYISYLYKGRFDHARAVALRDPQNGKFNTDCAISLAFEAYKSWFKEVEKIGLIKARDSALDPLKGVATQWY